jgi:polysaccharide chain length determinant protein (PEP-CTERM system associated)
MTAAQNMTDPVKETFTRIVDEIRSAARFRWLAIITAWLVCALGWFVISLLPDVYESSARVYVDTRTALSPVIQGLAIQQDVGSQINLVQQSLLGESQLQQVIQQTNLAANARTEDEKARIIARLRQRVMVSVKAGNSGQPGGAVYSIYYKDVDRERSLKVVKILLDSFVSNTLGGKRESSETAEKFLEKQIRENEQRLRDAEQQLADFKKKNVGTMPGAEGDYFTRLQSEMEASKKAQVALSVAMSRRNELAQQLRDGASAAAAGGPAVAAGSVGGGEGRRAGAADTSAQILEAKRRLTDLLLRYTDKHPEVGALQDEIAELEQRREREIEALRRGDPSAVIASGAVANPVYQSIQLALNQADVEIAALRSEIGQHDRRIAELRALVKTVPEVEAEFARLNRDYDVTKTQYLGLVDRLGRAKLGQDAEETSAVRFEIVDPPTASFQPVAPKRPRLIFLVFMAGIGLGAGLAYLRAKLNPVFNHQRELEEVTGLPVFGEVSLTSLDKQQATIRRGYLLYSATAVGLVVACVLVFLIQTNLI